MKEIIINEDYKLGDVIIPAGSKIRVYEGEDANTRKLQAMGNKIGDKVLDDMDADKLENPPINPLNSDKIVHLINTSDGKTLNKFNITNYSSEYIIKCLQDENLGFNIFETDLSTLALWIGSDSQMRPILCGDGSIPNSNIKSHISIDLKLLKAHKIWSCKKDLVRWDVLGIILGRVLKGSEFGFGSKYEGEDNIEILKDKMKIK